MKYLIATILSFLLLIIYSSTSAQDWEKTYGGSMQENGMSVQQTTDSGFIVVGTTRSFGAGNGDIYMIKTDANGDTSWTRTFGGNLTDEGSSVQQTFDGGYIVCGTTQIFSIDVIYLVKTDAMGILQWSKTVETGQNEFNGDIIQTRDSGYCIASSIGNFSLGGVDVFLIRTDINGDTLWTKRFDHSIYDLGYSIKQTIDDGFIIAASTYNQLDPDYDAFIIKTDSHGDTTWTKILNEIGSAYAASVELTIDSGYIVGGNAGENFYAVKFSDNGTVQWSKTIDKGGLDRAYSITTTTDSGYVLAGHSIVNPEWDVLLIKLNFLGNEVWSKKFDRNPHDEGWDIQSVNTGGFIIVGTTFNPNVEDIYLIKTGCNDFPVSNITVLDTFCQGDTMMSTLFINPQLNATYQWSRNDTNIAGATSHVLLVNEEGDYRLIVTDSNSCSNKSEKIYVNFQKPYFRAYPDSVCPGDKVSLGNVSTFMDDFSEYHWDFGDGSSDTGRFVTHAYQNLGTYYIVRSVIINGLTCNNFSDSVVVSSNVIPPVDFDLQINSNNMLNNVACPGDKIEFIPYAYTYLFVPLPFFEAASYSWDFGDGTSDTIPFPTHYYTQDGNYTIKLIVTNHCGNSDSATTTILIDSVGNNSSYHWKDIHQVYNHPLIACEQATFYSFGGINYEWNFDDGTVISTSDDSILHAFTTAGSYSVTLISTNGCGTKDTISSIVNVAGVCNGIFYPNVKENSLVIFPNPFSNSATIEISSSINLSSEKFEFRIFDLQGRCVKQLSKVKSKFTIDRENLLSGLYFYQLTNSTEVLFTGKLILQ